MGANYRGLSERPEQSSKEVVWNRPSVQDRTFQAVASSGAAGRVRRISLGVCPVMRLNTALKVDLLPKPQANATSRMVRWSVGSVRQRSAAVTRKPLTNSKKFWRNPWLMACDM